MSRAAASNASKAAQKEMLKEKAAQREAALAMGLTKDMQKAISADTLLCTVCGASQLGPDTQCTCKGGRTRPPEGYDATVQLLAAAKARHAANVKAKMGASAAKQASVQAAKAKKREAKDTDGLAELDLSTIDYCEVEFLPGAKLGMSIEKNAVSAVADAAGGQAAALGVKVGWLIRRVNGVDVPADRTAIIKATAASMKAGPVKITFQIQLEDNTYACVSCDKFVHADEFDGDQLELGPGKHMCRGCAEFADMF
uniref:Uncharacterized protein n=1 Tax=Chrysotila carterae TaxID=13221 RepID=A0A7S4ETR7_CHRCT|mmetsp:Transcript_54158/g.118106  ORF Transcript_54158/g.118106 Transcript_54158/m.118106 type:complete len:255 (+) Transcript_54158:125-889(+)